MLELVALTLSLVVVTACNAQLPEQREASAAASAPTTTATQPVAAAEPKTNEPALVAPPSEPASEPEPEPAPPTPIAATGPEPAVAPLDPSADPLLALLGRGDARDIEILASYEHGRTRIVLIRVDVGSRFRASQPENSELLAKFDEGADTCDSEEDNHDMIYPCSEAAAIALGIAADVAPHLVWPDSYAWELAQVEFDRQGKGQVVARKRLLDFGLDNENDDFETETKLKVYDMDGDRRSEILVVFPFSNAPQSMHDLESAALGYVIDKVDFHVQYATTRKFSSEHNHVSFDGTEVDTTWLAKDENGDGHPDLRVREQRTETHDGDEDRPERNRTDRASRTTVCLYELAGDRWVCPDALGTEIIDGNKLVERTRVPVVLDPPG